MTQTVIRKLSVRCATSCSVQMNKNNTKTITFCANGTAAKDYIKSNLSRVTFKRDLKWNAHIEEVVKKLSTALFTVTRMMELGYKEIALAPYYSNNHGKV